MSRAPVASARSSGSTPPSGDPISPSGEISIGERRKITRKPHSKSRLGCRNCKTRRIKCNEEKPQCGNCKRLQVPCDYANLVASRPGAGPGSSDDNQNESTQRSGSNLHNDLPIGEIELTYHWTTCTYKTLSAWHTMQVSWRNIMADVGFQHHHTMRLIFALTALHMGHCRPERREEYLLRSDHYYGHALTMLTPELSEVNDGNYRAVSTSVQLICYIGLAKGPQFGEYLAFSDGDRPQSEWLIFFRGVKTTRELFKPSGVVDSTIPGTTNIGRPVPQDPNCNISDDYEQHLHSLRDHIDCTTSHDQLMLNAVEQLLQTYRDRYGGKHTEHFIAFSWLYSMSDEFLARLKQRQMIPLIIYAYFTVLMHAVEQHWYMEGWTHHVMSGIWRALPEGERAWLSWPIDKVGWIPP